MDIQFNANNRHLEDAKKFAELDIHLRRLYAEPYVFKSKLLQELPRTTACILTLGGGRQVGKTTFLKQWMEELLKTGVTPEALFFFSGELIDDHHQLYSLIKQKVESMPKGIIKYILLDEVTYISNWDKAVKYLADTGELEECILLLTGSDLILMDEARKRFPGRRGKVDKVDFHYYPLSFKEFVDLKTKQKTKPNDCFPYFDDYLIHGGYMSAINDYAKNKKITGYTLSTYSDWVRGDVLKRHKQEHYLRDIIQAIIKHHGSQISWDTLTKELSINHTQTIADYINLLESMDACFIQYSLREDTLSRAPKKRKKVIFNDPFIFHAMKAWLKPKDSVFEDQIMPNLNDSEIKSQLVESVAIAHFKRYFETYYINAKSEIDIAYIHEDKFWPVEIKWRNQLRSNDISQLCKYKNSVIYSKAKTASETQGIPILPLADALYDLSANQSS